VSVIRFRPTRHASTLWAALALMALGFASPAPVLAQDAGPAAGPSLDVDPALKAPSKEEGALRIAATVNDQMISEYDVVQRLRLIAATTGLKIDASNVNQVRSQILQSLIDEKVQNIAAVKDEVTVGEQDILEAIDRISAQNNRSRQEIEQFLLKQNVDLQTFVDQVRAQLLWEKIVTRRFLGRIVVSEEEVENIMKRVGEQQEEGRAELQVAEIFLPVENPSQTAQIRQTAERLVSNIRGGAAFANIARQFSQSATAQRGGDLGWVQLGQIPQEIESVLTSLAPGQVSEPIQTPTGFYIIQVKDKREGEAAIKLATRLVLKHMIYPVPKEQFALTRVAAAAGRAASQVAGCDSVESIAKQTGGLVAPEIMRVTAGDLPPNVRAAVLATEAGKATQALQIGGAFHVMAVCEKQELKQGAPNRREIEDRLREQQLQLQARRLLRDLRRDASIDIR